MSTITLPPAATNSEQVYLVECTPTGGGATLHSPTGELINSAVGDVIIAAGKTFILYSNGVDGYSLVNY